WGEPDRAAKAEGDTLGGEVLGYDLKPFKQVEALIEDDSVGVVRVTLDKQPTVAELARRLKLQDIEPVDVSDDRTGSLLAVAFPEKGLTLLVDSERYDAAAAATSDAAVVTHLVLEPIDARAFTLRAERRSGAAVGAAIADLDRALALTPNEPHTLWLSSRANLSVGQAAAAADAAGRAVDLDETDATARVAWAEALLATGEFDQAVFQTRRVLDDEQTPEVARAQALGLMGRLAALGDAKIARKAIDFQNAAIEIADRLATSEDTRERRLAKDLLVDCHLAIAREVAGRDYNDKASTVAEWIGRASGLAEDRIETDGGGLELRLRVARGALAALAEMRPTKDPAPWIAEAQEAADTLLDEATDPLFRARVHWELGEAYQHAVRIEHTRGEADRALGYGTRAIDELSAGAEPRTTSIDAERLVGTLYFYLGAVNAVHNGDHQEAVGWYDKGRPILTADRTPSDLLVPRRGGEALVSMGVSYWNLDQRELAVELTESGARLMERGVSAGVLGESALAVPYGNLATMLGKLGENDRAAEYRRLAKGVAPAKTPADDATASAKPQRSAATGRQTRPTGGPTAEQSAQTAAPSQRRTPERVAGAQPTNQRATDQASTGSPSGSGRAISRRRIGGKASYRGTIAR
ncbi:MAG: tetratricopeptide repeat protein, partial [Planctomycetota bacterium]